jgi:chemotaxis protein histidine kinase CheA
MPPDKGRKALADVLARARVAVLDLAPEESHDSFRRSTDSPSPDEALPRSERASAAVAELQALLEGGDDTLRTLLAADMVLAVDAAASANGAALGCLVALLMQSLSVLADDPPENEPGGSLPSRSPLALANELRALRGAPLLSGNAVFAVAVNAGVPPGRADGGEQGSEVSPRMTATARRLRSYYQQGLVAWLRGDVSAKAASNRIGEVFARLHALSEGSPAETLWRAASSFANLLGDPRWRMSAAVKRLLGQLDGRLKALGEGKVPVHDADAALAQDLIFYVGEGHDVDVTMGVFPSRSALLKAFTAPPRAHPDHPTAVLSVLKEVLAISGQIMEALAPDDSWLAKRGWLTERMVQVADGLGLLGVHELRLRALREVALLQKIPGSGEPPAGGWGRVADRLHALGADLLTASGMEPAAAVAEDTAGMPSSGRIARRLEADLVHAEGVIQRLEQGQASPPAESQWPPAPPAGKSDGEEDLDAIADQRRRLDAFAGAVRTDVAAAPDPEVAPSAAGGEGDEGDAAPAASLDHALLDDVARIAGDIDGARSRLEQQVGVVREGLEDMDAGIRAMREELHGLRVATETLRTPHDPADAGELPPQGRRGPALADVRDRLDRLGGRLGELLELRDTIDTIAGDSRAVLVQQARDNVALEQRLMQTRMQPLDTQLNDLRAEVSERASHAGKQVLLQIDGAGLSIEPEKMAALLPVLRSLTGSMVEAGVEPPRARVLAGRPPGCLMEMRFKRRGADLTMVMTADCRAPEDAVADAQAFLRPLGGRLELLSAGAPETRCELAIPLAPRVSTVLLVGVGSEILALPLAEVEAVLQLSAEDLEGAEESGVDHGDTRWRLGYLGDLLALGAAARGDRASRLPLVLMSSDGERRALVVDAIGERVDVVVRSVVPQLRSVPGLAGAAILGDGQVVLLLDVGQLMESRSEAPAGSLESVS